MPQSNLLKEEKAYFSTVGEEIQWDYSVVFADAQKAQMLRNKLRKLSSIFDSNLEIASALLRVDRLFRQSTDIESPTDTSIGLNNHIGDIGRLKRTVGSMVHQASSVIEMVSLLTVKDE